MSAYLKFFQLEKSPFDTRAQSNLVLGTKALRTAFGEIEAGLADGAPRICVTGKEGLGKTSLARALPKLLGETARVVLILNPSLPWSTLRSAIVKQLDLAEGNLSRKTLLRARAEGRRLVIAVDQAERISSESLDHLDILLGYKSDDDEQLMHCVLLANLQAAASQHNAQGEQTPLLWWLDKINTLQLEFTPIPAAGVTSYVQKHLKRAGWKGGQIFTPDAMQAIHRLTGGVPREMSELCERALELAGEEETLRIDGGLIEDVFGEIPLEEAIDSSDVTDSAFIGAKDDDAEATTTTFGGGASARPATHAAAAATLGSATDSAAHAAGNAMGDDVSSPAQAAAGGRHLADDPRIDRMPTPGRRVHAPVDAPVSLDSFFGDSLGSPRSETASSEPDPHSDSHAETDPMSAADTGSDSGSGSGSGSSSDSQATAPFADALSSEAAPEQDSAEATTGRGGRMKWIGIAAGIALLLGGGVLAVSFLMGGEDAATDDGRVIARPKVEPVRNPVAGIERVPRTTDGLALDGMPAIEPGEQVILPVGTDGVAGVTMLDSQPDSATPEAAAEDASAAAERINDRIAEARAKDTATAETDSLFGFGGAGTATPKARSAGSVKAEQGATDPNGLAAAVQPADDVARPAAAVRRSEATSTNTPAGSDAAATTAAPAAPAFENPADAEVDAPYW